MNVSFTKVDKHSDFDSKSRKKDSLNTHQQVFPRWASVSITVSLILISIGVVGFFIIPNYKKPRTASYKNACGITGCSKSLNLECINGICDCTSDKYYANGCQFRKHYGEPCNSNSSYCVINSNLSCLDGICKCDYSYYWDLESSICLPKNSNDKFCKNNDNECMTSNLLYCESISKKCLCPNDRSNQF